MDLGEEPTEPIQLLTSKYFCLIARGKCSPCFSSRELCSNRQKSLRENHNRFKKKKKSHRVVEPSLSRCIPINNSQHLRLRDHQRGGCRKVKSRSIRKVAVRLCLLGTSKPMRAHQRDHLNMSWTRTTAMGMSELMRESLLGLAPTQRTRSS